MPMTPAFRPRRDAGPTPHDPTLHSALTGVQASMTNPGTAKGIPAHPEQENDRDIHNSLFTATTDFPCS